jgi:hypothetical protein
MDSSSQSCNDINITESSNLLMIKFNGTRTLIKMQDYWQAIKGIRIDSQANILIDDSMSGKITLNDISGLMSDLLLFRSCFSGKIAIVLRQNDSYDFNFFDKVISKYKINIKHCRNEKEAAEWLIQ